MLFEEFIENPRETLAQVHRFLGLREDVVTEPVHANPGAFPKHLQLTLLRNRLLGSIYGRRYHEDGPRMPPIPPLSLRDRLLLRLFRGVAPMNRHRAPPVAPDTRAFLSRLMKHRNLGLDDVLQKDLSRYWATWNEQ